MLYQWTGCISGLVYIYIYGIYIIIYVICYTPPYHGKEVYMANILPETEVRGSLQ